MSNATPAKKSVPITDLPIYAYTPTDKGRMCIAFIGDLPVYFKRPTVEAARKAADAWRHEEVAKIKSAEAKRAEKRLKQKGAE